MSKQNLWQTEGLEIRSVHTDQDVWSQTVQTDSFINSAKKESRWIILPLHVLLTLSNKATKGFMHPSPGTFVCFSYRRLISFDILAKMTQCRATAGLAAVCRFLYSACVHLRQITNGHVESLRCKGSSESDERSGRNICVICLLPTLISLFSLALMKSFVKYVFRCLPSKNYSPFQEREGIVFLPPPPLLRYALVWFFLPE